MNEHLSESTSETIPDVLAEKWRAEWNFCNPQRRLTIPGLCNFIQLTAGDHANIGHIGMLDMLANKQAWVLNRLRLKIDAFPGWEDIVEVRTWVESLCGPLSKRNFHILKDGRIIASVSSLWVCIHTEKRTPEHLVLDTEAFPKRPDIETGVEAAAKVPVPAKSERVRSFPIQFSHIDGMHHVNNLKYIEWCVNCLPYEQLIDMRKCELEMNFLSELHYGDSVEIRRGVDCPDPTLMIFREGENRPSFVIRITA